jgi:hypothetical protein
MRVPFSSSHSHMVPDCVPIISPKYQPPIPVSADAYHKLRKLQSRSPRTAKLTHRCSREPSFPHQLDCSPNLCRSALPSPKPSSSSSSNLSTHSRCAIASRLRPLGIRAARHFHCQCVWAVWSGEHVSPDKKSAPDGLELSSVET